jgi:hypothetical protein
MGRRLWGKPRHSTLRYLAAAERRERPFGRPAAKQQHATRFRDTISRPAPQSASCSYGGLVIAARCGEVRRRRAELAKYDMRRSTIRRPREPASDVAQIASSLRRLGPPARATGCARVFGLPVRSTEPGSYRLIDWWPNGPQEGHQTSAVKAQASALIGIDPCAAGHFGPAGHAGGPPDGRNGPPRTPSRDRSGVPTRLVPGRAEFEL